MTSPSRSLARSPERRHYNETIENSRQEPAAPLFRRPGTRVEPAEPPVPPRGDEIIEPIPDETRNRPPGRPNSPADSAQQPINFQHRVRLGQKALIRRAGVQDQDHAAGRFARRAGFPSGAGQNPRRGFPLQGREMEPAFPVRAKHAPNETVAKAANTII
jgi:hypothetical protein